MPNSLKCRLKRLVHKGLLSEKDLSRLYTDNDVIEETIFFYPLNGMLNALISAIYKKNN